MSTKNSLIPVNHSNIKLIDDNFNSLNKREINSGYIEKFTGKEDSQLNNQNTKKENIEHFSNSINACPVPIYKQWTNLEIPSLGNYYLGADSNRQPKPVYTKPGTSPPGVYTYNYNYQSGEPFKYGDHIFLHPPEGWIQHNNKYMSDGWGKFYIKPTGNKKNGDILFYGDDFKLGIDNKPNGKQFSIQDYKFVAENNNGVSFRFKIPWNERCLTLYPRIINNGDYSIKRITVRCDDRFEMYINGQRYSGSGWNRFFTFNKIPIKNTSTGFNIAFKCYNGGGPGCLIACIELNNGSVYFTDDTWDSSTTITNEEYFLKNPNNYSYGSNWTKPNVIGYNKSGVLNWDGRRIWWYDRYFVDSRFSQYAKWIWAGSCFKSGYVYFKKTIGEPPKNTARCKHNLTYGEALCYMDNNPDVKSMAMKEAGLYKIVFNSRYMTLSQHQEEAKRRGGNLISIHSKIENDQIKKYWRRNCWIGALRISDANKYGRGKDTWKWLDGTEWNWTNFQPGEPNNWGNGEGGLHTYWNGNWNDISVDRRLPGIYKIYNKSIDMNKAVSVAQKHWKMYGCTVRENKTYACAKPPNTVGNFKYEGCYNDNYHTRAVPNYGGVVKNLGECSKIAEKKREAVFGVKDGYNCYTSNDLINAKKYDTATGCSTMGKKLGYQIYNRHPPYPPINKNLTKNDFSNSIEHFENEYKFNNKYSLLIIIILLIILIYYFNV